MAIVDVCFGSLTVAASDKVDFVSVIVAAGGRVVLRSVVNSKSAVLVVVVVVTVDNVDEVVISNVSVFVDGVSCGVLYEVTPSAALGDVSPRFPRVVSSVDVSAMAVGLSVDTSCTKTEKQQSSQ